MPAQATGVITANGNTNVAVPSGASSSFPGTFAVFGTFSGGTVAVSAGFYDQNHVLQSVPIAGASFTGPGATNIAVRCDALIINVSGAGTPSIGYWLG